MLRTNIDLLVKQSVLGTIVHPRLSLRNPYLVDASGGVHVYPSAGGITYNVSVGDSAIDFVGDHVEPCVSITSAGAGGERSTLGALSILSCIGNEAVVVSGAATGSTGTVTGKHGGVEHVLIDFEHSILERLAIGDNIQVRAFGQGLELKDFPDIKVMNIDPGLLSRMEIRRQKNRIVVPVTYSIPAALLGSGLGKRHSFSGDYDIQISDSAVIEKYKLRDLRLGDVIAVMDADCRFGGSIRSGSVSIGVIVHASCITSGHGPGMTVILSTGRELIVPKIDGAANIANFIKKGGEGARRGTRRRRRH
jgi:hypothetical protein